MTLFRRRSLVFALPLLVRGSEVLEHAAAFVDRLVSPLALLTLQESERGRALDPAGRARLLRESTTRPLHLWTHDLAKVGPQVDEGVSFTVDELELRPGEGAHTRVVLDLPEQNVCVGLEARLLMGIGDALGAWWGLYSPPAARFALRDQVTGPGTIGRRSPPFCLPLLKLPSALASPDIPPRLEWANYWSAPVAERIGFPAPDRDQAWLPLADRSPSTGAWCLRLTDAPMDLSIARHVDALRAAYERFGRVGARYVLSDRAVA